MATTYGTAGARRSSVRSGAASPTLGHERRGTAEARHLSCEVLAPGVAENRPITRPGRTNPGRAVRSALAFGSAAYRAVRRAAGSAGAVARTDPLAAATTALRWAAIHRRHFATVRRRAFRLRSATRRARLRATTRPAPGRAGRASAARSTASRARVSHAGGRRTARTCASARAGTAARDRAADGDRPAATNRAARTRPAARSRATARHAAARARAAAHRGTAGLRIRPCSAAFSRPVVVAARAGACADRQAKGHHHPTLHDHRIPLNHPASHGSRQQPSPNCARVKRHRDTAVPYFVPPKRGSMRLARA